MKKVMSAVILMAAASMSIFADGGVVYGFDGGVVYGFDGGVVYGVIDAASSLFGGVVYGVF